MLGVLAQHFKNSDSLLTQQQPHQHAIGATSFRLCALVVYRLSKLPPAKTVALFASFKIFEADGFDYLHLPMSSLAHD